MAKIARRSTSWLLITLALVALVLVFLPAPKADALPTSSLEAWYFSDATFTEQVGYKYRDCTSYNEHWGVTTSHAWIVSERPCSVPTYNKSNEAYVYACYFDAPSGTVLCYTQSGP